MGLIYVFLLHKNVMKVYDKAQTVSLKIVLYPVSVTE